MPPPHAPTWIAAVTAALLGWLFALMLILAGLHALGWVVLCGLAVAGAAAVLSGRFENVDPLAAVGFTYACLVLEWPMLTIAYVLIYSWITGEPWAE
jgi:hypothetical protein